MAINHLQEYVRLVPEVKDAPDHHIWLSYDKEVDTLYVNFKKPGHATDSELTDDDVIVRYENDTVIGYTIMNASSRS